MSDTVRFGVSIDDLLLQSFDKMIEEKGYKNRSEAIRDLIRDNLVSRQWEGGDEECAGTISLVYDHHTRDLAGRLTTLQHDYGDMVICTTHVHLDHHNCLEVLVVMGPADKLKKLGDRLIGTRGVKHGKLTMTTTGEALS